MRYAQAHTAVAALRVA